MRARIRESKGDGEARESHQEGPGSAPTAAGSQPPDDSRSALTRRPEGDAGLGVRLRRLRLAPGLLRLTGRARQERSHGG